jgi:hypothetical protein
MLKREGIQFQICKNPDVKCSVVERAQRTMRENYKNTSHTRTRTVLTYTRNLTGYNATVHSTTGMSPAKVTDSDILTICKRMNEKRGRIPIAQPKFIVGQNVRITKEKMKFAKGGEQNYTTEVFRIIKVIRWTSRPVYELED